MWYFMIKLRNITSLIKEKRRMKGENKLHNQVIFTIRASVANDQIEMEYISDIQRVINQNYRII
jgi:hypothetical protein